LALEIGQFCLMPNDLRLALTVSSALTEFSGSLDAFRRNARFRAGLGQMDTGWRGQSVAGMETVLPQTITILCQDGTDLKQNHSARYCRVEFFNFSERITSGIQNYVSVG
jgi:hypothetical protein